MATPSDNAWYGSRVRTLNRPNSLTVATVVVTVILTGCSTALTPSPTRDDAAPSPTPDEAAVDAAAAASDPSPGPILTGSPPPPNEFEATIIAALQTLGIEGEVGEHGFRSASIWTPHEESPLFVHSVLTGTDRGEFAVLGERAIEGVTVRRVEYASGPVRDRFECDEATYEADGATPPGFKDFDAFLAAFIAALHCESVQNGS